LIPFQNSLSCSVLLISLLSFIFDCGSGGGDDDDVYEVQNINCLIF